MKYLGAYIGNGVENFVPWTEVLEKVDSQYARWDETHPTTELRVKLDRIISGSLTQYLTQVNGMPKHVLKHLLRSQRDFVTAGAKTSPISRAMLMAPKSVGGKGMLDLEARNEAIMLVKAAPLAEMDPEKRAPWAALAIHRLGKHIVKSMNVEPNSIVNFLGQSWHVSRKEWPP